MQPLKFTVVTIANTGLLCLLFVPIACTRGTTFDAEKARTQAKLELRAHLQPALAEAGGQLPKEVREISVAGGSPLRVEYGLDLPGQLFMEGVLRAHRPDYAAFVAVEADTGRVLSLCSFVQDPSRRGSLGNLALRATFPAASIFKIVTAAAALDQGTLDPESMISFTGSNHTLYRRNVIRAAESRWAREMSLSEAFAKSVNTVFAKIGLFHLKAGDLELYANRFQFNRPILSDLPAQGGAFSIPEYSRWVVAEAASGFNRFILLSPLHGAMIAATIANEGVMMQPYLVNALYAQDGTAVYQAAKEVLSIPVRPRSAEQLREMMQLTVERGTSRKAFRGFRRVAGSAELEVGGKTGSLTGTDPEGKYDWFVGYGVKDNQRIGVAALTINIDQWRVKSSYLARRYLEHFFREPPSIARAKR